MNRGGRRQRRVTAAEAPVWCPRGRWGPRRVRTTECHSVLRAEDVYTALVKEDPPRVRPGARGSATYTAKGIGFSADWEVAQNAVWRLGRVFLRCSRCSARCTRLYLPIPGSWLACRLCWGLTYGSRTLRNYKESLWGRGPIAAMFGTTQREMALDRALSVRRERRTMSRGRWAERRQYLASRQS
jgi:hypothetical protein